VVDLARTDLRDSLKSRTVRGRYGQVCGQCLVETSSLRRRRVSWYLCQLGPGACLLLSSVFAEAMTVTCKSYYSRVLYVRTYQLVPRSPRWPNLSSVSP
jgi:hypothetical protein